MPTDEGNHIADVNDLRQEMEQLRVALAAAFGRNAAHDQQIKLILPPPVKLPMYNGKDDPLIWAENVARTSAMQHIEGKAGVLSLRDYLNGSADDEIHHQNPDIPKKLLEILENVFSSKAMRPQRMREFYNQIQITSETVRG